MAGVTPIYGFPYQEAADPPDGASLGEDLAEAVETALDSVDDRADALEDWNADCSVSISTTKIEPLATVAGTDAVITTVSHTFKQGFAYRISWEWSAQFNSGTSPFFAYTKIRRNNASGTEIRGTAGIAAVTTNVMTVNGSIIVKRTGADTTQTIALIGGMSGSGLPSSLDVEASATRPTMLVIERIGTATKFSGAGEVPTT